MRSALYDLRCIVTEQMFVFGNWDFIDWYGNKKVIYFIRRQNKTNIMKPFFATSFASITSECVCFCDRKFYIFAAHSSYFSDNFSQFENWTESILHMHTINSSSISRTCDEMKKFEKLTHQHKQQTHIHFSFRCLELSFSFSSKWDSDYGGQKFYENLNETNKYSRTKNKKNIQKQWNWMNISMRAHTEINSLKNR